MQPSSCKLGFVSTRLAGTDGVSLETFKWAELLTACGHDCHFFAGQFNGKPERSYQVDEAHFRHPDIRALNDELFAMQARPPRLSHRVDELKDHLVHHLHQFVERYGIELLIAENCLSLPVNLPLGLALTQFIAETRIPTIAHHHDFWWERPRFAVTCAADYLAAAFPPTLPSVHHVVINSFGGTQLALRTGASSMLIPNVMDFDTPPPARDSYSRSMRAQLGLSTDAYVLLQPTRIVPRKRIEHAIEFTRRLDLPASLVISHAAGDERESYSDYLAHYAELMGVHVVFAGDRFEQHRGRTAEGKPLFSLADAYHEADLVTYPSTVEGFGNAFLEAIYYRRPLLMSTYEIYRTDIAPKGFRVVGFTDFIEEQTVADAQQLLTNPALVEEMTEHNFRTARNFYSYSVLESQLLNLLQASLGR